jgi:HK97 family phage major capsid protein
MTWQEKLAEAQALLGQVKAWTEKGVSAEEKDGFDELMADYQRKKTEAVNLKELTQEAIGLAELKEQNSKPDPAQQKLPTGFKSSGEYLYWAAQAGNVRSRAPLHPALKAFKEIGETDKSTWTQGDADGSIGAEFAKATMVEGTGARGGFLLPVEFRAELLAVLYERNIIRERATVIPMRRRQINVPVLDQTSTTAGQPHMFGGILATWTEESAQKAQNDATFRQIELVAHKLICYTRASDELLDDSAIGLDSFLRSPMGFAGAIRWQEDFTFLQGTGVGQPLGVINAGATIAVPAVAVAIGVNEIMEMVQAIHGEDPIWHISRSQMADLFQLNGPAGNPSYIFIPNAVGGAPATLMGFPIEWTEKCPIAGQAGDYVLADWTYYLIGDRQATTIESTNLDRWRYDETSWRAVHRVDGQPWLSAPITLQDGTTQISPFVIRGAVAS